MVCPTKGQKDEGLIRNQLHDVVRNFLISGLCVLQFQHHLVEFGDSIFTFLLRKVKLID